MLKIKVRHALMAATATPFICVPAMAQNASAGPNTPTNSNSSTGIQDIVVTAQKRAESVQDTPLAITATSGDALRGQNVTRLEDLNNATPNLNINSAQGNARITIRGISLGSTQPGSEANVAYHVDGVYVSRPTSTLNSFFDVERLEVVRGPQGTLYGRNATGGAINVITRDPTDTLSGFGQVTLGNYATVITEAGVGGPIASGISARIAFQTQDRNGFGTQSFPAGAPVALIGSTGPNVPPTSTGYKDEFNDLKTRAVRGKLKFESGDVQAVLAAEYYHQNDASGIFTTWGPGDAGAAPTDTLFGGLLPNNPERNAYSPYPQKTRKEDWALTGTVTWDVADALQLTSITGYRNSEYGHTWDQSGTQLATLQYSDSEKSKQISEELRASGRIGDFSYVLGGFLYHEKQDVEALVAINNYQFGFPVASSFLSQGYGSALQLKTDVRAVFGQLSYDFTDKLGIDVGGRYNWERKNKPLELFGYALFTPYDPDLRPWSTGTPGDINLSLPARRVTSSSFKPKVTLRYKPNSDLLFYATYSQGFKSGGFNFGSGADSDPFLPEEITSYEVGFKSDFLDRKLQLNLSAFYYNYTNLQVSRLSDAGTSILTESAGKAKIYGLEASIIALPMDDLRFNLDVGLLHARYKRFSSANSGLINCVSSPVGCALADPADNVLAGVVQDLRGNHLTQAPDYNINAGLEYTVHGGIGDFTLRGQTSLTDDIFFTAFNTRSYTQKAYALFDAFVRYEHTDGHLYGSLFIKNIGDKLYATNLTAGGQIAGATRSGIAGAPRTFGGSIGYRF